MAKGQAFLSEEITKARGPVRHLNVVITEPDEEMNYLVVSVTTWREDKDGCPFHGQDDSCILKAGCHPFIKQKSYVSYKNARKMSALEILIGIQKGFLIRKEDMDKTVIQDMQKGAENSPYLPEEFYQFFRFFL